MEPTPAAKRRVTLHYNAVREPALHVSLAITLPAKWASSPAERLLKTFVKSYNKKHAKRNKLALRDVRIAVWTNFVADTPYDASAAEESTGVANTDIIADVLSDGMNLLVKHRGDVPVVATNAELAAAESLMEMARYGETEELLAMLADDAVSVDVNAPDNRGTTPLHYAAANGHAEIVEALLERGATHGPNESGNTPFHWAVQQQQLAVVKLLVGEPRFSIDVLAQNGFGKGALTLAFETKNTEVVGVLLAHQSADVLDPTGGSELAEGEEFHAQGGSSATEGGDGDSATAASASASSSSAAAVLPPLPPAAALSTLAEGRATTTHDLVLDSLRVQIRELAIGESVGIDVTSADADETGLALWSAAIILSRWLLAENAARSGALLARGQRIIELGAGCGLPGIAVAAQRKAAPGNGAAEGGAGGGGGGGGGAAATKSAEPPLVITDLNTRTLDNIRHNAQVNELMLAEEGEGGRGAGADVKVLSLDWAHPERALGAGAEDGSTSEHFDLVIGADLVCVARTPSPPSFLPSSHPPFLPPSPCARSCWRDPPPLLTLARRVRMHLARNSSYEKETSPLLLSLLRKLLPAGGGGRFLYVTTARAGLVNFIEDVGAPESGFSLVSAVEAPEAFRTNPLAGKSDDECALYFNDLLLASIAPGETEPVTYRLFELERD